MKILLVFNPAWVNPHVLQSLGQGFLLIPTKNPQAPDIRLWDLNNIQNGDPLPPEVIEKIRELTAGESPRG